MCQKKKDELQHKHSLICPFGARTGQITLPAERKDHTMPICREEPSRPEVFVCRINLCWLSNSHSVSCSLTIPYCNSALHHTKHNVLAEIQRVVGPGQIRLCIDCCQAKTCPLSVLNIFLHFSWAMHIQKLLIQVPKMCM